MPRRDHRYVVLKICIHNSAQHRELPFYEQLNNVLPSQHSGACKIRKLINSFNVEGPHGSHIVLVHQPSQSSLHDLNTVFRRGRGFDEALVKSAIIELLVGLDFLHHNVQAVHTGMQ